MGQRAAGRKEQACQTGWGEVGIEVAAAPSSTSMPASSSALAGAEQQVQHSAAIAQLSEGCQLGEMS